MDSAHKNDRSKLFATGNTLGLIIKFSIPTIIGMLVNALYTLIDRIFVGHLPGGEGTLGIAGITISAPVTVIIFAVAMLAGAGAAANISLSLGRGDRGKAEQYIGNGLVLGVVLSLVMSVLFIIFRVPVLMAFGASGKAINVLPYAEKYLIVMLVGTTINTFGFCLTRYILAQGFSSISMWANIIGVSMNIILAPLFLFVFRMGIAGSALATVLAQTASAAFALIYFKSNRMPLKIHVRYLKPDFTIIKQIAAIGISPCALQLAMSSVQVVLNGSLEKYGGDVAIAAMGVVGSISMVLMMPIFGINQGVQPIIGFNYGAKLYHRVSRLLLQSILIATGVILLFWIVLMLGAEKIMLMFGGDNVEMMKLGPQAIRMFLMALPFVGFQVVSANYFQSIGRPMYSLVLNLSRQVLMLIPAVLILPLFLGLNGVFYAGPVADLLSSVLTGVFFFIEFKRLGRLSESMANSLELASENS